ncbi:MAG: D-amino-acid transaminase [Alphaproteobacteria bacterium]|nr:MAG: D-amino-acid transaminase [Alphaproteobacteria bacterium]
MSRIAYVNGRYVPHCRAAIHIEDRGYQFSDGVYEVCLFVGGRCLDLTPHLDRLSRSLAELRIAMPMSRAALTSVMHGLMRRNRIATGTIYVQVTRGVAPRDHAIPREPLRPATVMTARRFDIEAHRRRQETGIAVVTVPDPRWKRCDIKSVSLLGNVLARDAAAKAGAAEAWMVDEAGRVTEGASSTAWIVDQEGRLLTRSLGPEILPGITRAVILSLAAEQGIEIVELPFSAAQARAAREAFTASTTRFVMPVVKIDGEPVGDGRPGPLSRALIARHWAHVSAETGYVPPAISDFHSASSPLR